MSLKVWSMLQRKVKEGRHLERKFSLIKRGIQLGNQSGSLDIGDHCYCDGHVKTLELQS